MIAFDPKTIRVWIKGNGETFFKEENKQMMRTANHGIRMTTKKDNQPAWKNMTRIDDDGSGKSKNKEKTDCRETV